MGGHESGMDRDTGFVVKQISKFEGFAPMPARGVGTGQPHGRDGRNSLPDGCICQPRPRLGASGGSPLLDSNFAELGLVVLVVLVGVCDELCLPQAAGGRWSRWTADDPRATRSAVDCWALEAVIRSFRRISVRPLRSSGAGSCAFHLSKAPNADTRAADIERTWNLLTGVAADPKSENPIKKVDGAFGTESLNQDETTQPALQSPKNHGRGRRAWVSTPPPASAAAALGRRRQRHGQGGNPVGAEEIAHADCLRGVPTAEDKGLKHTQY